MSWDFNAANFEEFGLKAEHLQFIQFHNLIVTHWEWSYEQALKFQRYCIEKVKANKKLRAFIFCNHPHCFTLGRGLQRGKSEQLKSLTDFDEALVRRLNFPLFKINRGGGLTFHYPGQWIVYPIVNLNNRDFSLSELVNFLFETSEQILSREYNLKVEHKNSELIGLWWQGRKLASLGIAIEHFVTSHGMALNVFFDKAMFRELAMVNPCGMPSETYICLDQVINKSHIPTIFQDFHQMFLDELINQLNS